MATAEAIPLCCDTYFKFGTTAKRGQDRTYIINIEILSVNGSVDDALNQRITKRLKVAFWKALGEKESNLLWTDVKREPGCRTCVKFKSMTPVASILSKKFDFYEDLPFSLMVAFDLKPKVFQVQQI